MLKFVKNCKKHAMTLAELIVVFAIIGIVATMTLYTAKPLDKSIKYAYAKAYDTLGVAFYNARTVLPKYLGQPAEGMEGDWPTTSENFCKMLLEYINYKDTCTGGGCVGKAIPLDRENNDFKVANCSADTISVTGYTAEQLNPILNSTNPHFIAANGMKFWIGHITFPNGAGNSKNTYATLRNEQNNIESTVRYYVVIVDLNGDMRPNRIESADSNDTKIGDIVAFAVTDTNQVVPLGRPEIDRRYLSARVVYNVNLDDNSSENSTSNSLTYFQAKRFAWGQSDDSGILSVVPGDAMTFNFYGYQGENQGIDALSPFYLNLNSNFSTDDLSITFDKQMCGSKNGKDENGNTLYTLDPNACYVKIVDYY